VNSSGDDSAVAGSPLKLHDYLADVHLSETIHPSSNTTTVSRQPLSAKDARYVV